MGELKPTSAYEVLKELLGAMEMQEKREAGEYHIPQATALGIWNDAKARARSLLESGESAASSETPEFTDWGRAALLWVLWHHHGGSSNVGQPIRFALGMGQFDRLSDEQIAQAKRWAASPSPSNERKDDHG